VYVFTCTTSNETTVERLNTRGTESLTQRICQTN